MQPTYYNTLKWKKEHTHQFFFLKTHRRIDVAIRNRSRLPQSMRQGCLWEIKSHDCNTGLQTTQQVILFKEREEKKKANHWCGEIESNIFAYCLKPTAHCCHNYYIGLLEALWDIAVNMKLSEMYLKILSIFLCRMDTHQTKRMREHRQHWCGRELCPSKTKRFQFPPSLGAKGNFSSHSSSPSRCVAGVWLIKATQRGAVALCHLVLLLCVASASREQKYSFERKRAGTPACCYASSSPFLFVRVSRVASLVYSPHIVIYQGRLWSLFLNQHAFLTLVASRCGRQLQL